MTESQPVVEVTLADIYTKLLEQHDALRDVSGRVDMSLQEHVEFRAAIADHEARIRRSDRWVSGITVSGAVALVVTVVQVFGGPA